MSRLRFSLFDQIEHPGRGTLGDIYRDHVALAVRAEAAGVVRYMKSEHHMVPLDAAPSINLFLAALSQRTSTMRLTSLVSLLPFYEPYRLFEEICMLDHLSGGRFEFGFGKGVSPAEHMLWGLDPAQAAQHSDETLEVVLGLLRASRDDAAGGYSHEGRFHSYDAVPIEVAPLQDPFPPLWRPGTLETAAEFGVSTIVPAPNHAAGDVISRYRTLADERADQRPDAALDPTVEPVLAVMRRVVVAPSDDEAEAIARRAWPAFDANLTKLMRRYDIWPDHVPTFGGDVDVALASGTLVVGAPERVRDHFAEMADDSRIDDAVVCLAWGDMTGDEFLRSMDLFGDHVMR